MIRTLRSGSGILALLFLVTQLGACSAIIIPDGPDSGVKGDGGPEENEAPIFEPIEGIEIVEGSPASFTVVASDPNQGQTITVEVSGKPAGANFNADTGVFQWTPTYPDITYGDVYKDYPLTFVATDDGDPTLTTEMQVNIRVLNDEDEDGMADGEDDDIDGDGLLNDEEDALGTSKSNADTDGDNIKDKVDNCPLAANAGQQDQDQDEMGDACDSCPADAANDSDGDGFCSDADNCDEIANDDQADADGDGAGDACDDCPQDSFNDFDQDGLCAGADNCPNAANEDQADSDADGEGDACDSCPLDKVNDKDGDGVCGNEDNCPDKSNQDQLDSDDDGIGDKCDTCDGPGSDNDEDGVCVDNCPNTKNADQADDDEDGLGNVCDDCPNDNLNDADGDGLCADVDNCPGDSNVGQEDEDSDDVGDACDLCQKDPLNDADGDGHCADVDNCPDDPNPGQVNTDGLNDGGDACDEDDDQDGIEDGEDNCPKVANPDQVDLDGNGVGDACDNDSDGDGIANDSDNCPDIANVDQVDVDEDGVGLQCDTLVHLGATDTFENASAAVSGSLGSSVGAMVDNGEGDVEFVEFRQGGSFWASGTVGESLSPMSVHVANDGVSYFSYFNGSNYVLAFHPSPGTVSGFTSQATNPIFWHAPGGDKTFIGLETGLYSVAGDASLSLVQTADSYVDSSGMGSVWGQGTLYIPVTESNATSIYAFTGLGLTKKPLIDGTVRYLLADPLNGNPWYCFKTGNSVSVRRLSEGQIDQTISLSNAAGCHKLEAVMNPANGDFFFDYKSKTGAMHEIAKWTGGGAETLLANGGNDATFYFAGVKSYIIFVDANSFVSVRDGFNMDSLLQSTQLYYPKASTSKSGHFGLAGSSKASGLGQILAFTTDGQAGILETLLPAKKSSAFVTQATMDESGVLWLETTYQDGGSKRYLGYYHSDADGNVLADHDLVKASQTTSVTSFTLDGSAVTLASVDGADSGIRLAVFMGGSMTVSLLGPAYGTHQGFLVDSSVFGSSVWITYQEGLGSWAVATFNEGKITVQASGLMGPPSAIQKDPESDVTWFKLNYSDGTSSYVSVFADGTLNQWQVQKSELNVLTYLEDGKNIAWGTLSGELGKALKACKLGTDTCYEMPDTDFYFLGEAQVNKQGLVHAVIQDAVDKKVYIWRSPL